ncbi:MAG: hypothetical protein WCK31_00460 [bacterium]
MDPNQTVPEAPQNVPLVVEPTIPSSPDRVLPPLEPMTVIPEVKSVSSPSETQSIPPVVEPVVEKVIPEVKAKIEEPKNVNVSLSPDGVKVVKKLAILSILLIVFGIVFVLALAVVLGLAFFG